MGCAEEGTPRCHQPLGQTGPRVLRPGRDVLSPKVPSSQQRQSKNNTEVTDVPFSPGQKTTVPSCRVTLCVRWTPVFANRVHTRELPLAAALGGRAAASCPNPHLSPSGGFGKNQDQSEQALAARGALGGTFESGPQRSVS